MASPKKEKIDRKYFSLFPGGIMLWNVLNVQ